MPRPCVAVVRITEGVQPSRAVSWNFRFATSTSSFPRSALFTTYTSPISRIPAFIVWTASPVIGISTTTVVCARVAISTSLCPAPTVSTNTMSMPSASRTRTASKVARASPPAWPRVAIDRMNTPGSTPVSAIRIRSPTRAATESCAAPFRAGTASRAFARRLEERDDVSQGGPRAEDDLDARLLELRHVLLRDDAAPCDEDVGGFSFLQKLHDFREQGHVSPAQAGEANRIDVLLDRGLDDVLRSLPQARIDDLHPRVAQRPGDDL